jgi:hypothetical protein
MSNLSGKSYAFNAITPISRGRLWRVRLAFLLIWAASFRVVQRLLGFVTLVGAQQRLVELSFIHFARWTVVRRRDWANFGGRQPSSWPRYDYILFCSNFNGDWEQYIEAFSEVVPGAMNLIWGTNVRFPGAKPITPFLQYIRQNQFDTDHYYTAYPGASATDIRGALALSAALDDFARSALSLPPDEFRDAFERFLGGVARNLSTTGPNPWIVDPEEPVAAPSVDAGARAPWPDGVTAPDLAMFRGAPHARGAGYETRVTREHHVA